MKNKILGSALMIAGTAIGAGMLAMPLTSAGIGFGATLALLIGLWLLLTYTGLLFMEVYQTAPQKDVGVASLAEQYFGIGGRILATVSLLILLYALLVAYMTGGSSVISGLLPDSLGEHRSQIGVLIFTLFFGSFVAVGVKGVDSITRVLFIGKLIAFAFVLAMMLPKSQMTNLLALPKDNKLVLAAIPIFFTSFGFHVIMASINTYLDANMRKIRIAVLIGTAIPLAAYVLWQLATHGVLSQTELGVILEKDPSLNGLITATKVITGSEFLGEAMRLFSTLALITSFLGVALGIYECVGDLLKRYNLPNNRWILTLLTFVPPLLASLGNPNSFLSALSYAGLIFAFYGLLLPIGLAWRARKAHPNLPYRVAGGNIALLIAFIAGIIIIAIPFMDLPAVVG